MYVSKILPGWPDQDPSLSLGMMYSNSVLHHPSNQIQDHQSLPYCCPAKGAFFPTELKVFTASKTMLSQRTPHTIRLGLLLQASTYIQHGTTSNYYARSSCKNCDCHGILSCRQGGPNLVFWFDYTQQLPQYYVGKKMNHSKPTDQKALIVNEVFDT